MSARIHELLSLLTAEIQALQAQNTRLSSECKDLWARMGDSAEEQSEGQASDEALHHQPITSHWRGALARNTSKMTVLRASGEVDIDVQLDALPADYMLPAESPASLTRACSVSGFEGAEPASLEDGPAAAGSAVASSEAVATTTIMWVGENEDHDECKECTAAKAEETNGQLAGMVAPRARVVSSRKSRRFELPPCETPSLTRWQILTKALLESSLRSYILRECWQAVEMIDEPSDSECSLEPNDGVRQVWENIHSGNVAIRHLQSHDSRRSSRNSVTAQLMHRTFWRNLVGVLHPHSSVRIFWNICALFLAGYDIFRISVEVFDPGDPVAFRVLDWSRRCFWCSDIYLSFSTGFFTQRSLALHRRTIAVRYASTWLGLDLIALIADWTLWSLLTSHVVEPSGAVARYFPLLRLVRLAKCCSLLRVCMERVNSIPHMLLIHLLGYLLSICAWVHISGCIWYAIGKSAEGGWTDVHLRPDENPLHAYFASTHWAVVQLQGSTEISVSSASLAERCFAVFVVLVSIVFLAVFFSKLTNVMLQLQSIWNESSRHLRALNLYLERHQISTKLSLRVKKYAEWKLSMDNERDVKDERLLQILPHALRREVVQETHSPRICRHAAFAAFADFNPRFMERICCDVLRPHNHEPDETVYSYGEVCSHMYFVVGGELQYVQYSSIIEALMMRFQGIATRMSSDSRTKHLFNAGPVSDFKTILEGQWLCEGVLWTSWTHTGDLNSETHASVLLLDGIHFGQLVDSYPMVRRFGAPHARRFINALNVSREVSDLFDTDEALCVALGLMEEDEVDPETLRRLQQ